MCDASQKSNKAESHRIWWFQWKSEIRNQLSPKIASPKFGWANLGFFQSSSKTISSSWTLRRTRIRLGVGGGVKQIEVAQINIATGWIGKHQGKKEQDFRPWQK